MLLAALTGFPRVCAAWCFAVPCGEKVIDLFSSVRVKHDSFRLRATHRPIGLVLFICGPTAYAVGFALTFQRII